MPHTTSTTTVRHIRRLPVGAEAKSGGGVHFRTWAPDHRRVDVVIERSGGREEQNLEREPDGHFSNLVAGVRAGDRYWMRIDGHDRLLPDPASRFQPDGPHGASEIVDPFVFRWTDESWPGVTPRGQVIYEMHVGTFTREGTWGAAARELTELASLGVTLIELMPVAEFAGRFGWGYDGVDLFAPTRLYGRPDDFRAFVDRAHAAGLGVILDVVYNHLGPDGNHLREFAGAYFSNRSNDWGDSFNFDGPGSEGVREFFIANAGYWIEEYHLDGLRLDATQSMPDRSREHIIAEIGRRARTAAGARTIVLIAENEPQETRLVRPPERDGYGLDALWNDDFHHSAMVALTGRTEAYYSDHRGTAQELLSAAKWGYLFQGQRYAWQRQRRGTPAFDLAPEQFVTFLENHDQVANTVAGRRTHALTSPGRLRAMTALLLLAPQTPMLFQGQEFAASAPFMYFADHEPGLAHEVRTGRIAFLRQFASIATLDATELPDPGDTRTFEACKLDLAERERHATVYALHRDLLRLRREDAAFAAPRPRGVDGAVLTRDAFVLRFFVPDGDDRLLIVNLGPTLSRRSMPEPLFAPPPHMGWDVLWSSEQTRYGGSGTSPVESDDEWRIPAEAAVVLRPGPRADRRRENRRRTPSRRA
jgi:maltooligosyltrehalose trehalohydrolase